MPPHSMAGVTGHEFPGQEKHSTHSPPVLHGQNHQTPEKQPTAANVKNPSRIKTLYPALGEAPEEKRDLIYEKITGSTIKAVKQLTTI